MPIFVDFSLFRAKERESQKGGSGQGTPLVFFLCEWFLGFFVGRFWLRGGGHVTSPNPSLFLFLGFIFWGLLFLA